MRRRPGLAPRQAPYKRRNPSGGAVWVARYRDLDGNYRYAKPLWNAGKSSFARKADAQAAIDEALERLRGGGPSEPATVGSYFDGWTEQHPRSERTNETNEHRIERVLDVPVEGRPLRSWLFDEFRRRHVNQLVDHMLREQGRAVQGARNILSALSAMCEDAIDDEVAADNPFKGIRLRRSDPRARKASRGIRVWTFEEIRHFATGGRAEVRARTEKPPDPRRRKPGRPRYYSRRDYEALILTPGLTGLRLGEVLALRREDLDGERLIVRASAHEGRLIASSDQKNHDRGVPVPPSLADALAVVAEHAEGEFLFATPTGRVWRERNFYRDVWTPARLATGLDPTPHEFRHSYVTQLRAAGVDDADLARVAGHNVETMVSRYTHALDRSDEQIQAVIG